MVVVTQHHIYYNAIWYNLQYGIRGILMDRFSNIIIRNKKTVIIIFVVVALVCVPLLFFVDINYNLVDYLP